MNKKFQNFITIFAVCLIIGVFWVFSSVEKVESTAGDNVFGWAWSDNMGWICFNSVDDPATSKDYGVHIDDATGEFSGYAWSDFVGWISFNKGELGGCPAGTCEAVLDRDTGEVSGWAKVLSSNSWIRLSDRTNGFIGDDVYIDTGTGDFHNYAWSDDYGWISFNCETGGPGGANVCASTGDYKVRTSFSFNQKPNTTNLTFIDDYCNYGEGKGHIEFNWTYNDPDGDKQKEFYIEVGSITPGWVSQVVNDGGTGSWGTDITIIPSGLELGYDAIYTWRVKVKDEHGAESNWVSGPNVTTPEYPYPNPDFTITPTNPSIGEEIQLCSTDTGAGACTGITTGISVCYNPTPCHLGFRDFEWIIPEIPANGSYTNGDEFSYNPVIQFDVLINASITLEIHDTVLYTGENTCGVAGSGCCSKTKSISATGLPLPEWWEISPSF